MMARRPRAPDAETETGTGQNNSVVRKKLPPPPQSPSLSPPQTPGPPQTSSPRSRVCPVNSRVPPCPRETTATAPLAVAGVEEVAEGQGQRDTEVRVKVEAVPGGRTLTLVPVEVAGRGAEEEGSRTGGTVTDPCWSTALTEASVKGACRTHSERFVLAVAAAGETL